MEKTENFLRFYLLATSLKHKIRQGSIYWNVESDRRESVAEHVYDTCILAISIYSEFEVNINLNKVLKMLIIHELEEIIIGDITPFDGITLEEKNEIGRKAVISILGDIQDKEEYLSLTDEFNAIKTPEAIFAYLCDKLDFDIQMKLYDDSGLIRIDKNSDSPVYKNEDIKKMIDKGITKASDIFYLFDKSRYEKSELFSEILDYIQTINLKELLDNYLNSI